MQFLKSLLRGLLSIVFKLSLVLLVVVGPLVMVFGTSTQLKQSLKASKIYDNGVSSIIDNAAKDSGQQTDPAQPEEDSPFDQQAVKDAAKTALTPAFVQSTSEQIIDGIYGWLQGKTPQPVFNIDVSGVKDRFTTAVGDYAVNRAKQLPACTAAQSRQLASEKIDPLKISCLPAGFNVESLRGLVADQLNKQETENGEKKDNLLQQTAITPDSLPKNDEGKTPVQSLTEKASNAPKIFHLVTLAPFILGALAVVSGGLILLLHDEKRRGLRSLAITICGIGVITLLGIFLSNAVFKVLEKSDAVAKADANIREPMLALVRSLSNTFNHSLMLFGIVYVVLGAGTLIALRLTQPKQFKGHDTVTHQPETPEEPAAETPEKTEEKPDEPEEEKPKKPSKTLIQ